MWRPFIKILLVSDTHGDINSLNSALHSEAGLSLIMHAGDYARDLWLADKIPSAQMIAVRGNCDPDKPSFSLYEILDFGKTRLFLTHGHAYNVKTGDLSPIAAAAQEFNCNAAVFGHTHIPAIINHSGILLLNPGTVSPMKARRGSGYGYIVLELDDSGDILSANFKQTPTMEIKNY